MKRNLFVRFLARLRVGRKLLLIYLLDLSAVVFISGILIHEKYIAIDFSDKELIGNAYVVAAHDALIDFALAGAGQPPSAAQWRRTAERLADAERRHGEHMQSAALNRRVRDALIASATAGADRAHIDDGLAATRALVTRIGNQSNLILDPDLDSYYAMSLSILRYPELLSEIDRIGRHLHDANVNAGGRAAPMSRDEMRTRYLVLEGQLDAVVQGVRSDYAEAAAANGSLRASIGAPIERMLATLDAYRRAAEAAVDAGANAGTNATTNAATNATALAALDAAQQRAVTEVGDAWSKTSGELEMLLHERVRGLFERMWLHLGTALFLLCAILCMVYAVAQQISRPLRRLALVMDTVRRTGDYSLRADWHSQDEIGRLVQGFNDMLAQLGRERDVQKELAASARASAAQTALVEATPVPMVVTAIPGHEVLHANTPALAWMNGGTSDPWRRGLDSEVRARFFQQLSDREAVDEFEVRWKAGGEPTWAMLSARRLTFQGRDAVLTAFTPINQLKLMEQRLELWGRVFEASSEAILILDAQRRVVTANPSFYRATGYGTDDVARKEPAFLFGAHEQGALLPQAIGAVDRLGAWHGEANVRRRAGNDYPVWMMVSAVRDRRASLSHYICTLIDITDRKKSEARIQFLAEHDLLTELPNRALFIKRLAAVLEHARAERRRVAVLFIDLDRFKAINDSLGHHIGDQLLRSVSRRLLQAVRARDTVSRLSGDEFTVILDGVSSAAEVSRLIDERLLPLMREPHELGGVALPVSCSVGVALFPDHGEDIETLMQNADAAMYHGKGAGRNLVKFFTPDMAERVQHRLKLEACLRTALSSNELRLEYQPCVDAGSGELLAVEGLLRWDSAQLGRVSPAEFIPIAEDTRLIIPIGAWVIEQACEQIAAWDDEGLADLRVSINLSAIQLRDPSLIGVLRASLERHRIAPGRLELEITETVLMDSAEHYETMVDAIRTLGVKLSLDDFGIGYSSLSYLNRFTLDRLKIDRAFVKDMLGAPADLAIVRAIVELGHELGLRVVAEGVESEHQARLLRGIGCDELQGFLFSASLAPEELGAWSSMRMVA